MPMLQYASGSFFTHKLNFKVPMPESDIPKLSSSELKVLELVAKGYTSEEIGLVLTIAKTTVQTHRRNMLRKTQFNNTQQLVGWAVREGVVK